MVVVCSIRKMGIFMRVNLVRIRGMGKGKY
jgi:hypothetical protein